MSEKLLRAREYEEKYSSEIPAEQRPDFHVSPPVGWCNDPNGFSFFQGEYHLFYQYHPYSTHWGPMHWGHCKTKDFIKWEMLPCALAPDTSYDAHGCFSGSAVEWNGKHYLMYTSVSCLKGENGEDEIRQTQSIAVGDGANYEKLSSNPVITAALLPEGSSPVDFRDPKIWREGDAFYAAVGSRSGDGSGQLALFTSGDMRRWQFVTILDRSRNEYGKMWECPDFFELDGKHVILVSPQEMLADGLEFHNGNGSLGLIGSYDRDSHTFIRERAVPVDYGMDFYAGQTLESPDGRRILIAWINNWENYLTPCDYNWSGLMTVPRELHVRNGRLYQNPVRELNHYYAAAYDLDCGKAPELTELSNVKGRVFDMTVKLNPDDCKKLEVRLACDGRFYTKLTYDGEKGIFVTDRTYSGSARDLLAVRAMEMQPQNGKITLRVLMDKYSIEVFGNDGEKAMTSLVYTPLEADKILFRSDGPFHVAFHEIKIQ